MRALGHEGAFEGVAAEGVTRRLLLDTGDGSYQGLIVGELLEMEGIVLRAPGCASFATASFPVLPVVRETGGRDRLSSLYCPISPNAAVIYGPGPRRGWEVASCSARAMSSGSTPPTSRRTSSASS